MSKVKFQFSALISQSEIVLIAKAMNFQGDFTDMPAMCEYIAKRMKNVCVTQLFAPVRDAIFVNLVEGVKAQATQVAEAKLAAFNQVAETAYEIIEE